MSALLSRSPRPWLATGVILIFVVALWGGGCTTGGSPPPLRIPDQYVLAYTTGSPIRVETVASNGGRAWSAPNSPLDTQGSPLPASIVAPGIAANPDGYVLAWFDTSGVLHTVTSPNGGEWADQRTHGTFAVDGNSRPSLAFHYGQRRWFVAFRSSANAVTVLPVRPSTGAPVTIAGVTTFVHASIEFANNQLLLVFMEAASRIGLRTSTDGAAWTTGQMRTPLSAGNAAITTETAPYLRAWAGGLWLATNKPNPVVTVSSWRIEIFASGDGSTWTAHTTVTPSFPFSEGPAVAGPESALVVADPGAQQAAMSLNGRATVRIHTNTQRTVSLAHGPAGRVHNLSLRFINQFRRLQPVNGREDVGLNVQHLDRQGIVRAEIRHWGAHNLDKSTAHFWSEGHPGGGFPRLETVVQRGETIVIYVTGDDGNVSKEIPTDTFISAGSATSFPVNVDVRLSGTSVPYQVDVAFSVGPTP